MTKKYILGALMALSVPTLVASAATPMFSVSGSGNSDVSYNVSGGEVNAPAYLYYYSPTAGLYQAYSLGNTNASGNLSGMVNASTFSNLNANWNYPVYVQVGGYESSRVTWPGSSSSNTTNGVTFSNTSPVLSMGGTGSVMLSGGNGSYYVLNNSNTGGVSASITGNTLNLYGATAGQANITVCSTGGGCGTFTTTVNSTGSGSPVVSSSNVTVNQGSQGSITLSGGSGTYTVSILSGTGVSTSLLGNTLYINGNATGSNVVNVCSANGGACTPVTVNVQSANSTNTNTGTQTGGQMSFWLPLSVGQNMQLQLSGGSGSYYLQSPMSSPALASISGNTLMINGQTAGSGTVTVCQTGGTMCLPIMLSVSNASTAALTGTGGGYFFDFDLSIGMSNQDVMELQKRLSEEGYFTATPTGYFGSLTAQAVMKYQAAHSISTTGYVGPLTRAELNR